MPSKYAQGARSVPARIQNSTGAETGGRFIAGSPKRVPRGRCHLVRIALFQPVRRGQDEHVIVGGRLCDLAVSAEYDHIVECRVVERGMKAPQWRGA